MCSQCASLATRRQAPQRLRQVMDTMDVCQSVLGNFFVRVAAGQFDLEQPEQLLKLLASMARNRLLNHVRDQRAARRDQRRLVGGDAVEQAPDAAASPSGIAIGKELLELVKRHLPAEEQELLRRRLRGQEWAEIAAEMGGSAEALRKKLARATDRVARLLGLDAVEGEPAA